MNKTISIQTDHYIFTVTKNTLAFTDLPNIIEVQEKAFNKITQLLKHSTQLIINYHLFGSPITCGRYFNKLRIQAGCEPIESFRTNAFAWYPNCIYATYNKLIKAIGCHEDTHLLAYEYFKQLSSRFFTEGLAVAFDEYWHGIHVHNISKRLLLSENIQIEQLLDNNNFDYIIDDISYPLAGSVCLWIIEAFGIEEMKSIYKESKYVNLCLTNRHPLNEYYSYIKHFKG
ncbi:MAG: hypothetical protein JW866_01765 [Ignavibacteriales bacterium]|nr:hypothetical protein [Ignavibacteriales bacterium]